MHLNSFKSTNYSPINTSRMKHMILFILTWLLCLNVDAQSLSKSVKHNKSISSEKLANIDALLKTHLENEWMVGAVVLIVKDNQVVYHKGHGYANLLRKKTIETDAIFRIMSQTKAITSVAIMQLFEQGKLGLDQHISDFIPEFGYPRVLQTFNEKDSSFTSIAASREITFRDLLTHTSGIDYPAIGSESMQAIYAKNKIPSGLGYFNEDLLNKMKLLGKLPLLHNPGERFTYGLNSDLLGCLVEIISGESLENYFRNHIFEPLGMKDSYFNVPANKADRLATVYTEDDSQKIIAWSPTFRDIDPQYPLMKKTYFSGGAGLSSTAFDYAIFLQMLLNGGRYNNKQILGRRTVELMLSPQLDDKLFGDDNFCLGFELTTIKSANQQMKSVGTFSWGGYYGTTYWADPKEKLVCLIMSQQNPNSKGFQEKIMNIIYGSLK